MTVLTGTPLVAVIDDDLSVRESLPHLLKQFGFAVDTFSSAEEFLLSHSTEQTRCLILDFTLPGMTGLDLQQELRRRQTETPIIFITADRDEAFRQRVLAAGAVACLFKPFTDMALLSALNAALGPT